MEISNKVLTQDTKVMDYAQVSFLGLGCLNAEIYLKLYAFYWKTSRIILEVIQTKYTCKSWMYATFMQILKISLLIGFFSPIF